MYKANPHARAHSIACVSSVASFHLRPLVGICERTTSCYLDRHLFSSKEHCWQCLITGCCRKYSDYCRSQKQDFNEGSGKVAKSGMIDRQSTDNRQGMTSDRQGQARGWGRGRAQGQDEVRTRVRIPCIVERLPCTLDRCRRESMTVLRVSKIRP